ncbi:HAMP domain-containing sensor histidine kinase [soil metagenome]
MINYKKYTELLKSNSYLLYVAFGLFILSFAADVLFPGKQSLKGVQRIIQADISKKNRDLNSFCKDKERVERIANKNYSEDELLDLTSKSYAVFIYTQDKKGNFVINFWNTQEVLPPEYVVSQPKESFFVKLSNGYYVAEKRTIASPKNNYLVVALIPIKKEYYINNLHLNNSFVAGKSIQKHFDITTENTGAVVKSENGTPLFYIKNTGLSETSGNNTASVLMRILATLLLFLFLNQTAIRYIRSHGFITGFLGFAGVVILIRIISYLTPVPLNFRQFELFSPGVYGANFILLSLGDLLINVLLFDWLIIFLRQHIRERELKIITNRVQRILVLASAAAVIILITVIAGFIIKSLVADSQISFDVINFFSLNLYSIIGFSILCAIGTGYFLSVQIIVQIIRPVASSDKFVFALIMSVLSLLTALFFFGSPYFSYYFFLAIWSIVFVSMMLYKDLSIFTSKVISTKFIFWIFFFSASITAIIVLQNKRKELENRKHFAENIANKTDPSGERMMNITLSDFRNDFLPDVFFRFYDPFQNHFVKDSLIGENFSGYLNKYDTKIYTYDSLGLPLFNDDSTAFNTLNAILETQARPTSIPGLFYYDVSFDLFNYINKKTIINRDSIFLGYVFIVSRPKNFKSDALYPQLFTKSNSGAIENSPVYAYGIYVDRNLVSSFNDYPFPTELANKQFLYTDFTELNKPGYSELWYKVNTGKYIVITKSDHLSVEFLTLFAYLFCGFLILIGVINIINIFMKSRFNYSKLRLLFHFTIRNQVHGTIIVISVVSFLIIGATTILFFINRYHKNNREKLSRTITVMENSLRSSVDSFAISNSPLKAEFTKGGKLDADVNMISETHAADINIYALDGSLLASSISLPYAKGILSTSMDPIAYYHLNKLKDVQFFQEQKVGTLKYLNNYVPIRNNTGKEFGYLNIPYFESENKLQEEISNFLVTIINLNAFIFLVAGLIAFFITNRITRSFYFISEKMKEVNLGKVNEVIIWNRKDEIGDLVKEYNKMVMKLDESADKLARNEREGAWREMARQVAHEIKNPLTPMKLNLQYLQMAIDNNAPNVKEISMYVSGIMLEQIDHLSKIASDFAQFANISHSNNKIININESIQHIVSLYSADEKITIDFTTTRDAINIKADKTHLQRLFTNLVQNAIQSVPAHKIPFVAINSSVEDRKVLVTIKDNGSGIPEEMKSKIFVPNFTTKTSGTGLGLAMCKGIVEKINGRIRFETQEGSGTTFFVQFPEAD